MDSMRTLNKSLPRSPRKRRSNPSADQLIQSFKSAALTVTKLYKTAVSDQAKARAAGYQDALDDLLLFLDREDLGLEDGEGWRVRQWATEHLDDTQISPVPNDSDDDRGDTEKRARSDSPRLHRTIDQEALTERPQSAQASTAPIDTDQIQQPSELSPVVAHVRVPNDPGVFTFRSEHPYPQAMDMEAGDQNKTPLDSTDNHEHVQAPTSTHAVRVEVLPRGSRHSHRSSHYNGRHNTRDSRSSRTLGVGAGAKRRVPVADWFELGDLGEGKEGLGNGSKRGKFA